MPLTEPYVRILIQHVVPTVEGPQISKDQPSFQLKTMRLTTQQVRDKLLTVLVDEDADSVVDDMLKNFLDS